MQRYLMYPIFARFIDTFPIDLSSPRDGEGAGILEKGEIKAKAFHLLKNWKAELIARLY